MDLLETIWSAIWGWVQNHRTASSFFTLMIGFLVYGLWQYVRPLWRRARAFGKATERIVEHAGSSFPNAPFPARHNWLNELWSDYRSAYAETSVEVGEQVLSPVSPNEHFSPDKVLRGYNRKVPLVLAGVFLGLGILGTFVGLVQGLEEVNTAGSEQLLSSVTGLLSGMSTAFWTSIGGISLSILWLLGDRFFFHRLQSRVQAFIRQAERHWPATSPDRAVFEALSIQAEQKAILQNLGTDMAQAFEEAINKGLTKELSPALASIDETLDEVASRVTSEQAEVLDEMAAAFQERLMGSVQDQFDELSTVIREATEWQQRVSDDVATVFEQVTELSEKNTELLETSAEAADKFLASIDGLSEAHESMGAVAENLEAVAGQTARLSEEFRSQGEVFAEANEEIRSDLARQLDLVQEQVESLAGFWREMHGDLDELAESLSDNLTEFSAMTEEKLGEVFNRFDSEMATVVEHLGGTLAEMREVTEELGPALQRIERSLDETLEPLADSKEEVGELARSIRSLDDLPRHLESASREMETAREALLQLHGGIESLNGRLEDGNGTAQTEDAPERDVGPHEELEEPGPSEGGLGFGDRGGRP